MEYTFCEEIFSDFFKEVYGARPRQHEFYTASDEEKQRIWNDLEAQQEKNEIRKIQLQDQAIIDFEQRISTALKRFDVGDRATALKWITADETFYSEQCVEHYVWDKGLLFTDYGTLLIKELMAVVTFKEFPYEN
tara:strand:- start:392 stop:796 length:405 start_codon:yes stop_codon:yes gene_type:complete